MQTSSLRRRLLQIAAPSLLALTFVIWGLKGSHLGWTKTEQTTFKKDEITGIDYPVTTKAFLPGVDFVGAGGGLSVLLALASFIPDRRKTSTT